MFTLNPANGDRSMIVIDSNYGFGESVVSGEVTPDNFRNPPTPPPPSPNLDILERPSRKRRCTTT